MHDEAQLKKLCEEEASLINDAFDNYSNAFGILCIKQAMGAFRSFVATKIGPFAPGANIDYKAYTTTLLQNIKKSIKTRWKLVC